MNRPVERAEIFAPMSDHRSRESSPRFRGDFDWAGNEELIVWSHGNPPSQDYGVAGRRLTFLRKAPVGKLSDVQMRCVLGVVPSRVLTMAVSA